ncbi:MAG TPA: ribbon-helix-helix protein, CopG family [Chloroflexota bacterium]|nr:ribbon-helix-helix protein, CopG family [Chloroflexota bacterium]
MPRSFRIDPELERRLCEVAEREGMPVSAVVREAIEKHCDAVLGTSLLDLMADYIGIAEGTGEDLSSRTGEAFTDLLVEKQERRRKAAVDDPD